MDDDVNTTAEQTSELKTNKILDRWTKLCFALAITQFHNRLHSRRYSESERTNINRSIAMAIVMYTHNVMSLRTGDLL